MTDTQNMQYKKQAGQDMREGFVLRYNREKYIGVIVSGTDRFFFHRDRIVKGKVDPSPYDRVLFLISDQPTKTGQLPYAKDIFILEDDTEADVLAGPDGGAL